MGYYVRPIRLFPVFPPPTRLFTKYLSFFNLLLFSSVAKTLFLGIKNTGGAFSPLNPPSIYNTDDGQTQVKI